MGTVQVRRLVAAAALAAIFAILAWGGIAWTRDAGRIASMWLPNAVAVAVLLRAPRRFAAPALSACFAANVGINVYEGDLFWRAVGLASANILEIIIASVLVLKLVGRTPRLDAIRDLGAMLGASVVSAAASAILATLVLGTSTGSFALLWASWLATDALGLIVAMPITFAVIDWWRDRRRPTMRGTATFAAVMVGAVVSGLLVFGQSSFPFLFLAFPIVVLAAFLSGARGTAACIAVIAVIASVATALNFGPVALAQGGMTEKLVVLQLFLATSFVMGLPVAAAITARRESERRFQTLSSFSPAGIFRTDAAGLCTYVNPAWEQITGLTNAQAAGTGWASAMHPDDLAKVQVGWAEAVARSDDYRAEMRWCHADGSVVWADAVGRPERDDDGNLIGFIGVNMDITERKAAEQALASRDEQLRVLAANVSDAIFRLALDGTCSYASPSAKILLGVDPRYLVGVQLLDRFHPDDDERVREAFARLVTGGVDQLVLAYRSQPMDAPGEFRWMEANCGLVRDAESGEPSEVIASIRDVSERKQLEFDLRAARERAEQATAAKAAFLANMSHELRTPMNGVIGFTELLLADDLADEQRDRVSMIAESGRAMMRLLNDILDMSKIDAGLMRIVEEPVDLEHKLRGCIALIAPTVREKPIELRLEVDPALPRHVVTDPLRLRQIILNLLGNAAKFTERGTIVLRAALDSSAETPTLVISVADSGIGIEPGKFETIFDQFTQADDSVARRFGGTGLGLSISNRLAGLMDGSISVESKVRVGTTFTLNLPLRAALAATKQPEAPALQAPVGAGSPRVLVAEDHDINQALVAAMAKSAGIDADIAGNGAVAIAMVAKAITEGRPYSLVLMDVQMPVVDGLEATRRLRSAGFDPVALPIVALTANAFPEDIAACLAAGMQGHLSKPLRLRDLVEVVGRYGGSTEPAETTAPPDALRERYLTRRNEVATALLALSERGNATRQECAEIAGMLHKLAGVAAYFGDAPLGVVAHRLEVALTTDENIDRSAALADGANALANAA